MRITSSSMPFNSSSLTTGSSAAPARKVWAAARMAPKGRPISCTMLASNRRRVSSSECSRSAKILTEVANSFTSSGPSTGIGSTRWPLAISVTASVTARIGRPRRLASTSATKIANKNSTARMIKAIWRNCPNWPTNLSNCSTNTWYC